MLAEHLSSLATLLDHATLTDPSEAPSHVRAYLLALPDRGPIGQTIAARELALTPAERVRFEREIAPVLAHAHQRLDAALRLLEQRDVHAAQQAASALYDWLR